MKGFSPVLRDMYATGRTVAADGSARDIHSHIGPEYAEALYRLVREEEPDHVLEVGMGFGAASLAILSALADNGRGELISIDPFQSTQWNGAGVAAVQRSGFNERFRLVEQPDFLALPELVRDRTRIDFAYIDGWHTFDYVLLDVFYVDRMLRAGRLVGFNDAGWPAIERVVRWVLTHRRYVEIDAAIVPRYGVGRYPHVWGAMARLEMLLGRELPALRQRIGRRGEDRYLRKLDDWEPSWDYYQEF